MRAAPSVARAPLRPASPADAAPQGEFHFEAPDFDRVRKLIHQRAGINLHAGKQALVYSRLSRRLRETGHRSFGAYLQWLEAARGAAGDVEWQEFVNCLTTNLTAFFREAHHFDVLAAALADAHRTRRTRARDGLRIWCNAASTGEEAYSLAMTVAEASGADADALGSARVIASDIDTRGLAAAARGVYAADARGLTLQRRRQHFMRGTGANSGFMRVKPELASRVEFRTLNLMDARWALGEPFDIVFCRNVMIYFDTETQRRVIRQLHAVMKPGGLLFVGHAENFGDMKHLFRLRGKTVYERL